jgi:pimeloyl-ACP methyl ester carboxylesterase
MSDLIYIGSGTHLEVADEGHGPVVVLLHGWPVTALHWRKTLPALHDAGFRTLMISLRGLGGASAGQGDFKKTTLAEEVSSLMEILRVDRYAVLGHDWGGTIGYLLSADHPDKIWALAVEEEILPGIDVAIPSPGKEYYPEWHVPFNRAAGLAEALVPGRENEYFGAFLRSSAGPAGIEPSAEAAYLQAYRRPGQLDDSLCYYRTRIPDQDAIASRSTRQLELPILAIGGEYGMGAAVAVGLKRVGRFVSPLVIGGAGHYPAEQSPDVFNPTLIRFLNKAKQETV